MKQCKIINTTNPHTISYLEWGNPKSSHKIICVHGLTRNSRDFDFLAQSLCENPHPPHIVCPDMVGRGQSDRLPNSADYNNQTYLSDCLELITHLGWRRHDWIGTSMGGILGMLAAAMPDSLIDTLILNDIGPFIPKAALQRIADYLKSKHPEFKTIAEAEKHLRTVHAPFGPLTDQQWRHLAIHGTHETDAKPGSYMMHYDPSIADAFTAHIDDVEFWPVWENCQAQVVLLRGQHSDILLKSTAEQMQMHNNFKEFHEFQNVGHAPALMAADQINVIKNALGIKSM